MHTGCQNCQKWWLMATLNISFGLFTNQNPNMLVRRPQMIHKSRRSARSDVSDYKNYGRARCEANQARPWYFRFLVSPAAATTGGKLEWTKIFGKPESWKDTQPSMSALTTVLQVLIFIKSPFIVCKPAPPLDTLDKFYTVLTDYYDASSLD